MERQFRIMEPPPTSGQGHTRMTATSTGTQAVDRAALLVSTVVRADNPLAFGDLAEECGLPRSTTSRLLTALERVDLLGRDDRGNYVPGELFDLHAERHDPWLARWDAIAALAEPVMERVSEATGETVNLGAPRGNRVLHVAQVDSRYILGTRDWTEVEVPPHVSSLGKVLLAHGALPLPTGPLVRLTPSSAGSQRELARHLDIVRGQGWAATVDELEPGLTGVAAPVHAGEGRVVVGALGVSGPTQRLADRLEETGRLLVEQAGEITALLATQPHLTLPLTPSAEGHHPGHHQGHHQGKEGVA